LQAIIAGLKRTMPAAGNAAETLMVESRLSAFIVGNRRGKRVSVQFMSSSDNPGTHTLVTSWPLSCRVLWRCARRTYLAVVRGSRCPGVHTLSTLSSRNGHFEEELVIPRKQASLISYQQP
jgi:hypothetical protein